MAGIEASMMTSLGTCKLVMPRSESTMAMPLRYSATSAVKAASSAWPCILLMASPKPLLGFTPRVANVSPYFSKSGANHARTPCPKMIGSETFIMVAFMCSENSTPLSFAQSTCFSRKEVKEALHMNEESTTSPDSTATGARSSVAFPDSSVNVMCTWPASVIVTDCSWLKKSPSVMLDTWLSESADHFPMRWGLARA